MRVIILCTAHMLINFYAAFNTRPERGERKILSFCSLLVSKNFVSFCRGDGQLFCCSSRRAIARGGSIASALRATEQEHPRGEPPFVMELVQTHRLLHGLAFFAVRMDAERKIISQFEKQKRNTTHRGCFFACVPRIKSVPMRNWWGKHSC